MDLHGINNRYQVSIPVTNIGTKVSHTIRPGTYSRASVSDVVISGLTLKINDSVIVRSDDNFIEFPEIITVEREGTAVLTFAVDELKLLGKAVITVAW